jgi:DNA repair photolyase
MFDNLNTTSDNNVIPIGIDFKKPELVFIDTPLTDKMIEVSEKLDANSTYKSQLEWESLKKAELRNQKKPMRGGFTFGSPFKLVNSHSTCQQCLYSFEVDTYGRGCVHNCVYCYAKAELTVHGYWNNPYPAPVNINEIRKVFHTVFETDRKSKFREVMEKRIPLRIGSMSDSFMHMDNKYGVTKELLRILKHYKYPYVIFTRSDLVAQEDYMELIDPKLASIQFSIASTNDKLNKLIEPGAPSAKRRLAALTKLNKAGFWTTVRINPLFPIMPDGYFTDPKFEWWGEGEVPKFDYSSFDMVDEIAATGTPSILAGFGRFSSFSLNQIEKAVDFDLRQFYNPGEAGVKKSKRDFHFSDREIRYYYEQIKERCYKQAVEFTTCYIGNGEEHFWKDQDLWSNKKDCCNVKGKVEAFKTDSRELSFETRLKFTSKKSLEPVNPDTLHKPLGGLEIIKLPKEPTKSPEATI